MSPFSFLRLSIVAFVFVSSALAQPYTFTHFAGTTGGPSFEDGTGPAARFNAAQQLAVDDDGNIYVADALNHTIRMITTEGVVTTLAGLAGSSGTTDGTGGSARFNTPLGVAVGADGSVYVADTYNNLIRKVTIAGTVTTIAGDGAALSRDGIGSVARFDHPERIVADTDGTLYVCDTWNHTIRKITSGGVVSTLAGLAGTSGTSDGIGSEARFQYPDGLDIDAEHTLYVTDGNAIRKVTAEGVVTTLAGLSYSAGNVDGTGTNARFNGPLGAAIDQAGNVYVADTYNHTIRKVTSGGVVTTFAGLAGSPGADDGIGAAARFSFPVGIAVDESGNLIVSSQAAIRKITSAGVVTTLAGVTPISGAGDGIGAAALFDTPWGITRDAQDNLFVTEPERMTIRKITSGGVVSTFAGLAGSAGSTDGVGSAARFNNPVGVAVDGSGNVLVGDLLNRRIRKIAPDQTVTTFEETDFYPYYVAVDSMNNCYVSDFNQTIQKIDAAGTVTTLAGLSGSAGSADGTGSAARFWDPRGVAVDSLGNVYVVDHYNHTIRKVTSAGVVTTLAGLASQQGSSDGTGSAARFLYPQGVSIGNDGNLYVTDAGNSTIRKVTPAGVVTTVGGVAQQPGSSDGTGSAAHFYSPAGVRMDSSGNLYVTDSYNHSIRKGSPALADTATIDASSGLVGAARQLGTSANTATNWHWDLVRRPVNSVAELSSATVSNPVFTPDVADLFVFRLTASNANGSSITTVSLAAGAVTTTTLTVSTNSSGCAQTRTFTAVVVSGVAGTIGGSVAFKKDGTLLGNVALAGGQASMTLSLAPGSYSFSAEYSGDAAYSSSASASVVHQVTSDIPGTPTAFVAVATSASQVSLSWIGNPCAAYYQIHRSSHNVPFTFLVNTSDGSFENTGLMAGVTYLYVVRAVNDAGASADSAIDGATTVMFTDEPLIAATTRIKAVHLTELRIAVNAFRVSAGQPAFTFTDPTVTTATPIRASHILELRTALAAAPTALALPAIGYVDPTITAGSTRVKATHFQEIRSAVQ